MIICYTVPGILCMTDVIIFHFRPLFALLFPKTARKIKILKKWKKLHGDIIILHMCTKNYDQMIYGSWDMVRDRCNCYFSFWTIFYSFNPPPSQPKKSKFWKNEKNVRRYHNFTYAFQKLWSDDLWFLRYAAQWMDRWMDGWKKWCIEVGAPPKKQNSFSFHEKKFIFYFKLSTNNLISPQKWQKCWGLFQVDFDSGMPILDTS